MLAKRTPHRVELSVPLCMSIVQHLGVLEATRLGVATNNIDVVTYCRGFQIRELLNELVRKNNLCHRPLYHLQEASRVGIVPRLRQDPLHVFNYHYVQNDSVITTVIPASHWLRWYWDDLKLFSSSNSYSRDYSNAKTLLQWYPGEHQKCIQCNWSVPVTDFYDDTTCEYCYSPHNKKNLYKVLVA